MKKDINFLRDQYNKYIYPKPSENLEEDYIKKNIRPVTDPILFWHRIFPERPQSLKELKILIAGCGTHEASILALFHPNHSITGIDLSEKSLDHNRNLINKHNIKNLKLICGDFRDIQFEENFDYIICSGVIHHLEDPGSALNYFYKNLKKDGSLALMLYGDKINFSIKEIKKVFDKLNLEQNNQSINFVKKLLSTLNSKHPIKLFSEIAPDIKFDAGVVDFCLHKSEKFFSIREIIELLKRYNFVIKTLNNGTIFSLTKFFFNEKEYLDKVRSLNLEEKLSLGQILNWNDRRISFVCTNKDNMKNSIIYNMSKISSFYVGKNPEIKYSINTSKLNMNINGELVSVHLDKFDSSMWEKLLSGKKKFIEILDYFDSSSKKEVENILLFLAENFFLDLSFYPINYLDVYNQDSQL